MVYLVREFKTPAELMTAVKARAKLHVWEEGKGDIQGDVKGLIVHGPGAAWKVVVELRGGIIVKVNPAED